jgi:hypothetical protein
LFLLSLSDIIQGLAAPTQNVGSSSLMSGNNAGSGYTQENTDVAFITNSYGITCKTVGGATGEAS